MTVALPRGEGVEAVSVPAVRLPVHRALPVLTRARDVAGADPAAAFWGAASLLALSFLARGSLLPGVTPGGHDAWRCAPLRAEDLGRIRELAAAAPPSAHALPVSDPSAPSTAAPAGVPDAEPTPEALTADTAPEAHSGPLRIAEPERLLRAFLDAVADTLPRSPAAPLATGGRPFAAVEPQQVAALLPWAREVAAGHDAGVRISLRIEVPELVLSAQDGEPVSGFRAVLQVHSADDPTVVADAADVWAESPGAGDAFRPQDRWEVLVALRRATRAWAPLGPLLSAAVPSAVEVADDEISELLGEGARALAAVGVDVHWPRRLARGLSARAVVGPENDGATAGAASSGRRAAGFSAGPSEAFAEGMSFFSAEALLAFQWRFALGGRLLTREELDHLAESKRPLVRLRDQWVLVDPEEAHLARAEQDRGVAPMDALRAVLTGSAEVAGRRVDVEPTEVPARLRSALSEPEAATSVGQPPALSAVLRDYQVRGLSWLARMTSLGLGGCLADDMGLGKTITLIALHLHRQRDTATQGPALVVCPASLMGNWQREVERFAPGTAVRRFHGTQRSLEALEAGEIVVTTYGTMRLAAADLDQVPWGLLVADEAQHIKNPYSATAKQLRTITARARVALTGTPVENNLSELWAILDWTTPGLLGTLGRFRNQYARAVEGTQDQVAAERLARLVRPFLLRRRKSDPGIAPELPPKTETDLAVPLTSEQTGLYEALVRETLAAIAGTDGLTRRGLIVKLLTGLKQICNHPAQYLKEDDPRIEGRSGKLDLLDELLGTILAEQGSVLVFTQYVRMARLLERHLNARGVRTLLLHGGTPVATREALVRRFQDGEAPVFLLSLKAAGTGLNLTRAEHVVHYDRWWNPAVEDQATDRAHRIGQTRAVQVHRLIAEGTVEDRIAAMLARKKALAEAVLGAGEAALTELTDAELADLVELRGGGR
ncbi:DEAD/DEAH box helicase [Streptomyces sp. TS71-3]|uniref:DEAD/DEAH box helicase n=1 Tax=Streptomyces sp. TS71-3 TaxID=2733862 RepID=UPI0035AB975D